jgi:hypothetical protein
MTEDELMAKILRSVRLEAVYPMRLKITKSLEGRDIDTHTFEVPSGMSIPDLQQELTRVVIRWKGGFPMGARYTVERVG